MFAVLCCAALQTFNLIHVIDLAQYDYFYFAPDLCAGLEEAVAFVFLQ